ncbi:MAG: TlpA family protein disulfide reductase [Lautropia sp.]
MHRRTLIKAIGTAPIARSNPARAAADTPLPAIGTALALVDAPLFDGGTFRASEAQGHVVLIYWWANWCPFCAAQTPSIQKLWDAQRSRGLKMLGLSVDRRAEDARRYLSQRGYTFPSGMNSRAIEAVLPKPGKALPVTCVRGRDGRVVLAEIGEMFSEDVEQIARFL